MNQSSTEQFHEKRNPRLLSYSGISAYQTCRHRWKLQNVYGLRTSTATLPMDVGSATHAGLEHFLKGQGSPVEGVDAWVDGILRKTPEDAEGVDDHLSTVRETAREVVDRVHKAMKRMKLKTFVPPSGPIPVELEIVVPMKGWDGFAAHIDWIAEDEQGRVWVVDFKTRSSFYDEESEDVNLQNAVYQRLVQEHYGITVAGTLTFQVRSDRSKTPKVNKNGTLSKAAIVCDWETYEAAVIAAGQDPADYQDMKDKLSTVEFTRVLRAVRTAQQLETIWKTIVEPMALEMARVRDRALSESQQDRRIASLQAQRSLSNRTCNGCNVRDVCINSLKGYDPVPHLSRFNVRERERLTLWVKEGTL